MSLAAFGCNPEDTGASLDDVGGHQPGTLAYSPDGGIYVLIQAGEAIAQCDTCLIAGNWQVRPADLTDDDISQAVCIPQVALANAHYGWGLVYGNGRARADDDIAATATQLYLTADEGKLDDAEAANTDQQLNGVHKRQSAAVDESDDPLFDVAVQWPHIDQIN